MGGASVALSDFNLLNISNPASYSAMVKHMPVFEMDGTSQFLTLKSNSGQGKLAATTFTKLAIGIPVNNRMGISFGLLPYTTTGYNITSTNTEPSIGDVTYSFKGKGGLNRTYLLKIQLIYLLVLTSLSFSEILTKQEELNFQRMTMQ